MAIKEMVYKNRSYRRFYQDAEVSIDTLRELVDLGRMSASAMNLQPLKYILSNYHARNTAIFANIGWAAYLKDWEGPPEGERPAAYIIMLGDTEISKNVVWDHGIAAQSILLGATERGLGGCMIATIRKSDLAKALDISSRYEILLVIAIGKPKEQVVINLLDPNGDVKYWRDSQAVHHVPKRSLQDIIIG
ncbi:MAG: nitroreductase family protein [Dehalococcoidia bacterium]|nr:nitroreductase family protein [Dehalococcoidia bacterium]